MCDAGRVLIYLAHAMPHKPLYASKRFLNTSRRGLFGDVLAELDWNVGRLLDALKEEGLDENTLVIFTSDNGPWLSLKQHGGSAGPLRGAKGTTYEGGVRVPFIARWPGRIPKGIASADVAALTDLLPTFVTLAGGKLATDHILDGIDISPLLTTGKSSVSTRRMFHYRGPDLEALRDGDWKLRIEARVESPVLELYHLESDVSEAHNLAMVFPEKAAELKRLLDQQRRDLIPGPAYQELINSREKLQEIYQPRGGVKLHVPEPGVR
jgi:arylsulfatase A